MFPVSSEGLDASERKRTEALQCIERARQHQADDNMEGAQEEVTNAWYALDDALRLCPSNHRARFLLVSCAMNADDYQRAKVEALKIYQDLNGEQLQQMNDSVLHLSIAHASKMLNDTEDAIRFAHEATELYHEDPQPYMVLGELLEADGQVQEAEQKCRQALMYNDNPQCRHPLNTQNVYFTLCCLGAALVKQGKYTEAEMFLLRGARLDTASTLALRHLVDVYHFQHRQQEAISMAMRICEMDPSDDEIKQKIDLIRSESPREALTEDGASLISSASRLPPLHQTAPWQPDAEKDLVAPARPNGRDAMPAGNSGGNAKIGREKDLDEVSVSHVKSDAEGLETKGNNDSKANKNAAGSSDWWTVCCFDRDRR